jgi:hypothetical protein
MRCPVCGVEVETGTAYHIGSSDECREQLREKVGEMARSPEGLSYEPVDVEVTKQ